MARIQSINPCTAFKVGFLIFAIFGLVAGALCSTAAFAGIQLAYHPTLTGGWALLPLAVCPVFWGLLGGVGAAIAALLYNFVAGRSGGLEVEMK